MKKNILKTVIVIMAILFIASLSTVMLAACNNKTENPSDQDAPPSEKEPYEFDYDFSHYKEVVFGEEISWDYRTSLSGPQDLYCGLTTS